MDLKLNAGPLPATLPDYLAPGLDIVFVGLNPGLQSVEAGHYFASPRNRFWTAVNRSGLLTQDLDATRDAELMDQGIGLTDVVKRPTRGASELRAAVFVVPNPSPANAVYSLRDLVGWYRCLKELREREKTP